MSFLSHGSKPIVNKKGAGLPTPFYYRMCISPIADRLPSGRACFLLDRQHKNKKFFAANVLLKITEGNTITGIGTDHSQLQLK